MTKLRLFSFLLFFCAASTFCMDVPEKQGYSSEEDLSNGMRCGPALMFAFLPVTIQILNYDKERGVYFYQPLFEWFEIGDRALKKGYEIFKLVIQNRDQVRINLGPLKYFALRFIVYGKQVVPSSRLGGYKPGIDQKIIEDLGPIKFNTKRGVDYHKTDPARLAELIQKMNQEEQKEEEKLERVDVMYFDPAVRRYGYEPLFVEDEQERGVLIFHKDAPEQIDMGPLAQFAIRKLYFGRNKPLIPGEPYACRGWTRWDSEYTERQRDEKFGSIEKIVVQSANGENELRDFHSKIYKLWRSKRAVDEAKDSE